MAGVGRVCFVVVFLGELPSWMSFFLRSCEKNPNFHWKIFTDSSRDLRTPGNVELVEFDRHWFNERVSGLIGTPYELQFGYKLCDLKPLYGAIFAQHLCGWEFWGYTDVDLVYGDIGRFLTNELLDEFDVLTASERILVGHLTVLRNSERCVELFRTCSGYSEMLTSSRYEAFDERDFADTVYRHSEARLLKLYRKSIQTDDCIIWWSGRPRFFIVWWRGHVWDAFALRELAYFHFIQSKNRPDFAISGSGTNATVFFVHDHGLMAVSGLKSVVRIVLSFLRCCIMTVPWYAKQCLKKILPQSLRDSIRRIAGRSAV